MQYLRRPQEGNKSPTLKLQTVASYPLNAGNQIWLLWKLVLSTAKPSLQPLFWSIIKQVPSEVYYATGTNSRGPVTCVLSPYTASGTIVDISENGDIVEQSWRKQITRGGLWEYAVPGHFLSCALLPVGNEVNAVILLSSHPQVTWSQVTRDWPSERSLNCSHQT